MIFAIFLKWPLAIDYFGEKIQKSYKGWIILVPKNSLVEFDKRVPSGSGELIRQIDFVTKWQK